MARTPSNMVSLGTKAPDFSLYDVISEEQKNLNELKGKNGSVIMFICNHCPYVKHVNKTIVNLANKFKNNDINFIAISRDAQDTIQARHVSAEGHIDLCVAPKNG